MAQHTVTLINVFEVPEGRYEEALEMWEASRDVMAAQPGYISTRLHSALDPSARFQLINIAEWESPADFQAAARALKEADIPEVEGLSFYPMLYTVTETDAQN